MKIIEKTIKNISHEFELFSKHLDHADFYTEFIIIIFEYEGDNLFNAELLKIIHPDGEAVSRYNKTHPLTLAEAKAQLRYGFYEINDNHPNQKLESMFWNKIEQYISLSKTQLYTGRLYGGFTLWCIFWILILIDEENKKGLLVNAGASD